MQKFRAAIIGCGSISSNHISSLTQISSAQIIACCDIVPQKAEEAAERIGCKAYYDYIEMLDTEKPDVVHICTPHHLHASMAIAAMERGCHVLTEKPMSIKLEDAEKMVAAADKNGVSLGVVFQNRFNAGSCMAKEMLESGKMGRVLAARSVLTWHCPNDYYLQSDWKGTWSKEGGGVIMSQAIHTFDRVRWLVDSKVVQVEASVHNYAHPAMQVEDSADGVIHFENGVLYAFYTMSYFSYDAPTETEIHCENGTIILRADEAIIRMNDGHEYAARRNPAEHADGQDSWSVSHRKQICQFYEALEKGEAPLIDGAEGLKTQRLVCALYDSAKAGRKIKL